MTEQVLSRDVQEFIGLLEKHDVRYLLVGGHAVFFHGYPRLTADVDFAYDPAPDNAKALYAALVEFWGDPVPVVQDAAELAQVGMIFQFGRPPNRIDLISNLKGVDIGQALARRVRGPLPKGAGVWLIGLEDLRRAKAAAGRPKDLDDLENLPLP